MRDNVLVRKKAGIILLLAKTLKIKPERAIGLFYRTDTNRLLSDAHSGIQLMSNLSLVKDILAEIVQVERLNVER